MKVGRKPLDAGMEEIGANGTSGNHIIVVIRSNGGWSGYSRVSVMT